LLPLQGDMGDELIEETETETFSNVQHKQSAKSVGLIRVKRNLFETNSNANHATVVEKCTPSARASTESMETSQNEEASNSLVYNKNSMDIYIKQTSASPDAERESQCSTPLLTEQQSNDVQFESIESIVCSPNLLQYMPDSKTKSTDLNQSYENNDDSDEDDMFIEEGSICTNASALYEMIAQNFGKVEQPSGNTILISSVSSLNEEANIEEVEDEKPDRKPKTVDKKVAIGGLYLRNPRGECALSCWRIEQFD